MTSIEIKEELYEEPLGHFVDHQEEYGEIVMKEEIGEEFLEDQSPLLPVENEVRLISHNENSIINVFTETAEQNCPKVKIEYPPSNVMGVGLLQFNSEALLCERKGKVKKKSRSNEKRFECSFCPYKAPRMVSLRRHERTHTGEKPFKCSFCSFQASRMESVRRHERIHSGEKPFKCSFCLFRAAGIGSVRRHERTHTGEKPFKCNFCPFQAAQLGSVQRHERTHTGEKPFKCSSCSYQAAQIGSLRQHERTHKVEKLFKCSSCPYQATHKNFLRQHIKSHINSNHMTSE